MITILQKSKTPNIKLLLLMTLTIAYDWYLTYCENLLSIPSIVVSMIIFIGVAWHICSYNQGKVSFSRGTFLLVHIFCICAIVLVSFIYNQMELHTPIGIMIVAKSPSIVSCFVWIFQAIVLFTTFVFLRRVRKNLKEFSVIVHLAGVFFSFGGYINTQKGGFAMGTYIPNIFIYYWALGILLICILYKAIGAYLKVLQRRLL